SGSIVSNIEDMARWVLLNLGGGSVGGTRLISERVLRELHSPQMAIRGGDCRALVQADTYGLGWYVGSYKNRRVISHGGNVPGFSSMVSFIPELDLGVVVLSNTLDLLGFVIAQEIYDRFLGGERRDWNAHFGELFSQIVQAQAQARHIPERDQSAPPPVPFSSYAGEYRHPAFGSVTVSVSDSELMVAFQSGLRSRLHHIRFNLFKGTTAEYYLPAIYAEFGLASDGAVAGIELGLIPGTTDIVFERVAAGR
nr:serine hydrolase [Gemmatimonadales bacterium]